MPDKKNIGGVYQRSIKSGFWYMASVVCQKVLNLATFIVLARLLVPGDYGIIAIVLFIVTPLNQLTTVSFGDALTQRQDSIERYLNPLFTLDLFRSCTLALIVFVSAPLLATFFHVADPSIVLLIKLSGLLLIIPGCANIRLIYLFKELEYRKIFFRDILAQAAYAVVAIGYAVFVERSAWALFAGLIGQSLVGTVASYAFYPVRPGLSVRFRLLVELFGYTKWVYGQEVLDVIISQIDKIFVGRLMSAGELGVYSKAKDLASMATNTVASMISKVGFAAFAKIQDRTEKIQEGFMKSIDVLILSSLPFTLVLLVEGGAVISLFLGQKWLPLVEPLKIFALGNLLLAFSSIVAPILAALGRPDINFKTNVIRLVVTIPAVYVGYRWHGMNGLAWAIVVTWVIMFVYVLLRAKRAMRMHRALFFPAMTSAVVSCSGVVVVDLVLRFLFPGFRGHVGDLVVLVGLSMLYFVLLMIVGGRMSKGPAHTAMSILRELRILPSTQTLPPSV